MDIKIRGLIWYRSKPDEITYSADVDGKDCYIEIPALTASLRERARAAGKSLGEIVDIVNRQITHEEDRRNPPLATFTSTITHEQARSLSKMFGLDYEPESEAQRADKVDGMSG